MTTLNNQGLNNIIKGLAICSMIATMAVSFAIYKTSMVTMAIYVLYALLYIQIPGLQLLKALKLRFDHLSTTICCGFFTGWALVVALYFVTELIGTNLLLIVAGPVLSIVFFAGILRKRQGALPVLSFKFSRVSTAFCIFAALVFLYAMVCVQYLYYAPGECQSTYMNPDKALHMGLVDALSHGWPIMSPWIHGIQIKYHVFTEILMAVPVRLFGVTADFAIFSFNPVMTTYVFGLSTYVFFRELLKNKERAGLCSLTVILANLFLVRSWNTSMAYHFAIINDNALGYGISGIMISVVLFKYWYEKHTSQKTMCWKYLLFLTAMIMLLTGIKGPIALVFMGAIWGTFILGLILKKVPIKTVLPILVVTAGFAMVYLLVLSGKGVSNGSGNSIFAFATIANISFFRSSLVALLKGMGIPKIIRLGVMLVVFMIFMLTAFFLPFVAGYVRELYLVLTGKKDYDFTKVLVYAAFLVGLIAMFIMNYSGHSQVYFGLVSVFFAPVIAFWFFEDMAGNKSALMNTVRAVFIISLLVTTFTLGVQLEDRFEKAQVHANPEAQFDPYLSISQDEYEAMRWIDENTPKDSLLATDRYSSVAMENYDYEDRWDNRFFLYATYSNRFCYIAGSGYTLPADQWELRRDMILQNENFYDRDNPNRADMAREIGIDYVVVSKRFNDFGDLSGDGYSLCFTNDDVDIYEIK